MWMCLISNYLRESETVTMKCTAPNLFHEYQNFDKLYWQITTRPYIAGQGGDIIGPTLFFLDNSHLEHWEATD